MKIKNNNKMHTLNVRCNKNEAIKRFYMKLQILTTLSKKLFYLYKLIKCDI